MKHEARLLARIAITTNHVFTSAIPWEQKLGECLCIVGGVQILCNDQVQMRTVRQVTASLMGGGARTSSYVKSL